MIAVLFTPIVKWISSWPVIRWHPGRGSSLVILLFGVLVVAGLFFWLAFPPILRDLHSVGQELPQRIAQLVNWLHVHLPFTKDLSVQDAERYAELAVGGASSLFQSVSHGVISFLTVLLMSAYFILDGPDSFAWFISLFPPNQQPRLRASLITGGYRMRRWLGGQALLMLAQG